MGKPVLLVWEVGGGQGHLLRLGLFGAALRSRGHETVFALRRVPADALAPQKVHQAPVWPGATDPSYRMPKPPTGHAGLLAELGIGRGLVFESMLSSWDRLFAEIDPAVIVADAAPACLAAARGRIPTVSVGNGFTLPPPTIVRFPSLDPDSAPAQADEAELLSAINHGLRKTNRPPLEHLPQLYAADRTSVGTFSELDPYDGLRAAAVTAPSLPEWDHLVPAGREEVFGYFSFKTKARRTALEALALAAAGGLRVRIHAPGLDQETVAWLTANRVRVEPEPVPLTEIQSRARLLISIGSLGFASFGAAAGIPHIVLPWSLATAWTGNALQRLGIGRSLNIGGENPLEPALLRQLTRESFYDSRLTERTKELAPDFVRRLNPRADELIPGFVEELL